MNNDTLKALRASIEKWERNTEAQTLEDINTKPSSCALCNMFAPCHDYHTWCDGCPVYLRTGKQNCKSTPYFAVKKARDSDNFEAAILACKDEVEFLKSLLPKEDEKNV
jgi:hypothetical protein